jgi:hypothetical protein
VLAIEISRGILADRADTAGEIWTDVLFADGTSSDRP